MTYLCKSTNYFIQERTYLETRSHYYVFPHDRRLRLKCQQDLFRTQCFESRRSAINNVYKFLASALNCKISAMYGLGHYVSDDPLFTLVSNDNHDEIHIPKTCYLVFDLPKSVAANCNSAMKVYVRLDGARNCHALPDG
jgi:hypothetical protein